MRAHVVRRDGYYEGFVTRGWLWWRTTKRYVSRYGHEWFNAATRRTPPVSVMMALSEAARPPGQHLPEHAWDVESTGVAVCEQVTAASAEGENRAEGDRTAPVEA